MASVTAKNTETQNNNMVEALQKVLASSYVFLLKKQNYHWNVKGPMFYSIHKLLEEQYTDLFEAIDEIAERITSLGGYAYGSFADYNEISVIKEEKSIGVPAEDILKNSVNDESAYVNLLQEAIEVADDEDDNATEDLLIGRLEIHQKNKWMLESMLG